VYAKKAANIEDMRADKTPEKIIMALTKEKTKGGRGKGKTANPKAETAGEGADEGSKNGS
ncbi:MAG: hypothetical protein AB3N24_05090, partial [Leisingera sp.]